jgi:phosphate ABC transporter phosphate-binding protein
MSHRTRIALLLAALVAALVPLGGTPPRVSASPAENYQTISGEGSSWAGVAIDAMRVNVKQFGITVNYNTTGSTTGRKNFRDGIIDFAASDIPFQPQPEDGSVPETMEKGSYAYIPVTAGGTAFMYNLKINGQRVTNLRLSGENIAKIFTGVITTWNDPALVADNPGLALPNRKVVPVVRSDGSGSTAQFTRWMIAQHPDIWNDYCRRSGRAPACGLTSFYPTLPGMIAQGQDSGVAGYLTQNLAEGAIGYVNYSYALGSGFPVAKVLNAAGYYTEPTPENVAVSLLKAEINRDENSELYLTQELDTVYRDTDPRNYPLSSYSYFILPTKIRANFNEAKGRTLGAFAYYAMCQAQQQSASLGYSPMPINLVQASFEQIRKIPGVAVQDINLATCKNPTFSPDGTNVLAKNAPQPQACDKKGPVQCATGTGGARTATPTSGGGAPATGGSQGGGAANGGGTGAAGAGAGGAAGGAGVGGVPAGGDSTAVPGDATGGAAACDADTGVCGPGAVGDIGSGGGDGVGAGPGAITTTLLSGSTGWSNSQSLIVLIFLLVLALVLGPAAAWRHLARTRRP